jgi:thioredoxin 1
MNKQINMKKFLIGSTLLIVTALIWTNVDLKGNKPETNKSNNDMNNFEKLITGEQPVLVDFYADWCAPCRMLSPVIEKVGQDMEGKVKVIKINVDNNQPVAAKYGVMSIPTIMLFQNGEVKWRGVGYMNEEQIKGAINQNTKTLVSN